MWVGDQGHVPSALPSVKRSGTHCRGRWVGPCAGLNGWGNPRPYQDPIQLYTRSCQITKYTGRGHLPVICSLCSWRPLTPMDCYRGLSHQSVWGRSAPIERPFWSFYGVRGSRVSLTGCSYHDMRSDLQINGVRNRIVTTNFLLYFFN
jgi:hypothetical protein